MTSTKTQHARSARIEQVHQIIRTKGTVNIDSLKGQLATQLGYSEKLIDEYIRAVVRAGYAAIEGDTIKTTEGGSNA